MNRNLVIIAVIIVVVVGGFILFQSQQGGQSTPTGTTTQQSTTQQEEARGDAMMVGKKATEGGMMQGAAVEAKNFAFTPSTIRVKAGEKVTYTNLDSVGHSVTSNDGTSFDTGVIGKDKSTTLIAPTKPGSYPFHCTPHPNMKGTLIVE